LPTPRGLSQAPTSFFGSWYQGIHRVPLLTWQLQMMLASTVQFSKYGRYPSSIAAWLRRFGPTRGDQPSGRSLRTQQRARPAQPLGSGVPCRGARRRQDGRTSQPGQLPRPNNQCSTSELPPRTPADNNKGLRYGSGHHRHFRGCQVLLRKEVIQPHLPVRLPCYDFVPIAGPTFDGSLPYGLGHRLRVLPTFVT
jgi:hypothetical protein